MAKVQIKSEIIASYGGIFKIMELFERLGLGKLVDSSLGKWGHKSQHVCHNVHKKSLARSLFYTCIYFELTKHLGCGFKEIQKAQLQE